jgi:hypothetical protein
MPPSPYTKHQHVSGKLFLAMATYLYSHRIGEVFAAPFNVVLSDEDIVNPDILLP